MTEKTFSEIEIGEHFQPIYKDNAKVFFKKIDQDFAEVVKVKNGETTKPTLYYKAGDIIRINLPQTANERFQIIAFESSKTPK